MRTITLLFVLALCLVGGASAHFDLSEDVSLVTPRRVARRLHDYGPPAPLPPFDPETMEDVATSETVPIPPELVVNCDDTTQLQDNICGVILSEIGAEPTQVFCESTVTCTGAGDVTVTTTVRVVGRGTNPNFDAEVAAAAVVTSNTEDLLIKAAAVPPGPQARRRRRRRSRRNI